MDLSRSLNNNKNEKKTLNETIRTHDKKMLLYLFTGDVEMAKMLIENGANRRTSNNNNMSASELASTKKRLYEQENYWRLANML